MSLPKNAPLDKFRSPEAPSTLMNLSTSPSTPTAHSPKRGAIISHSGNRLMSNYRSNDPLAAEFAALVEPFLRAHPTLRDYSQLHFALDGLHYLIAADRSGVDRSPPPHTFTNVTCSFDGCHTHAGIPDACILNFAPRDTPPIWLCRFHHPKLDGLPAPGWTPPLAEQHARALATTAAWNKLTPSERPLLNRNIVTIAAGGGE